MSVVAVGISNLVAGPSGKKVGSSWLRCCVEEAGTTYAPIGEVRIRMPRAAGVAWYVKTFAPMAGQAQSLPVRSPVHHHNPWFCEDCEDHSVMPPATPKEWALAQETRQVPSPAVRVVWIA